MFLWMEFFVALVVADFATQTTLAGRCSALLFALDDLDLVRCLMLLESEQVKEGRLLPGVCVRQVRRPV